ncbi:hypothetical protein ALQ25_200188 [Pseudomonas coronafaciens pv. atropurpurea]|nr:hypothetical protein ALQ25_200188 [Pseudomonas coronafaciens pv. atropurpurea]
MVIRKRATVVRSAARVCRRPTECTWNGATATFAMRVYSSAGFVLAVDKRPACMSCMRLRFVDHVSHPFLVSGANVKVGQWES